MTQIRKGPASGGALHSSDEWQDRRTFLCRAAVGVVLACVSIGLSRFTFFKPPAAVASTSAPMNRKSEGVRYQNAMIWLLSAEQVELLKTLCGLMFPDDGNGPSALDLKLVEALEVSGQSVQLYSEGMKALDTLSRRKYGRPFSLLPVERQISVLHRLDGVVQEIYKAPQNFRSRIVQKLTYLYYWWNGSWRAAEFWCRLRDDACRTYYSHDLTWKWLGYSGPPFPNGYLNDLRA
jgi:hypothetical protein